MITIHACEISAMLRILFDLTPAGDNRKIERIKMFRSMTGYGLRDSKELVEAEEERRGVRSCPIARALEVIRVRASECRGNEGWGNHNN
jgi:hypothetical protein